MKLGFGQTMKKLSSSKSKDCFQGRIYPVQQYTNKTKLNTQLIRAARNGNVTLLRRIILHGADIDAPLGDGKSTALHWAAVSGRNLIIEELLSNGATVDLRDADGSTPLMWACTGGNSEAVATLLAEGANIHAKDIDNCTAMHLGCASGSIDVLHMLIVAEADISVEDIDKLTPIHWSAKNGHIETLSILIEEGADTNAQDKSGATPLHWAASKGHSEVVKILLSCGANANSQDNKGFTPKMIARRCNNYTLAKFIHNYNTGQPEMPITKDHQNISSFLDKTQSSMLDSTDGAESSIRNSEGNKVGGVIESIKSVNSSSTSHHQNEIVYDTNLSNQNEILHETSSSNFENSDKVSDINTYQTNVLLKKDTKTSDIHSTSKLSHMNPYPNPNPCRKNCTPKYKSLSSDDVYEIKTVERDINSKNISLANAKLCTGKLSRPSFNTYSLSRECIPSYIEDKKDNITNNDIRLNLPIDNITNNNVQVDLPMDDNITNNKARLNLPISAYQSVIKKSKKKQNDLDKYMKKMVLKYAQNMKIKMENMQVEAEREVHRIKYNTYVESFPKSIQYTNRKAKLSADENIFEKYSPEDMHKSRKALELKLRQKLVALEEDIQILEGENSKNPKF